MAFILIYTFSQILSLKIQIDIYNSSQLLHWDLKMNIFKAILYF